MYHSPFCCQTNPSKCRNLPLQSQHSKYQPSQLNAQSQEIFLTARHIGTWSDTHNMKAICSVSLAKIGYLQHVPLPCLPQLDSNFGQRTVCDVVAFSHLHIVSFLC